MALDVKNIGSLKRKLDSFLKSKPGYSFERYLNSGSSASVFQVNTPQGARAIKVFLPKFLQGSNGGAERKRLHIQRDLIGHSCPSLIKIFSVEEALKTAFVEMEFIPWPSLTKALKDVPNTAIRTLIRQLAVSVKFLADKNIIHRDIKSDNIHVSPDFSQLTLLDLGVVRHIDDCMGSDAASTDVDNSRPFVATAQYSSPEYLFRLDEPSPTLWEALNIYQLGAVLHDLINKKQIFETEIGLNNRWLIARAVLSQKPEINIEPSDPIGYLKNIAIKSLSKDMTNRINLISIKDFLSLEDPYCRENVRALLLAKGKTLEGASQKEAFDRAKYQESLIGLTRDEIQNECGPQLPSHSKMRPEDPMIYQLVFEYSLHIKISVLIKFSWMNDPHRNFVKLFVWGAILCEDWNPDIINHDPQLVSEFDSTQNPKNDALIVTDHLLKILNTGIIQVQSLEVGRKIVDPIPIVTEGKEIS